MHVAVTELPVAILSFPSAPCVPITWIHKCMHTQSDNKGQLGNKGNQKTRKRGRGHAKANSLFRRLKQLKNEALNKLQSTCDNWCQRFKKPMGVADVNSLRALMDEYHQASDPTYLQHTLDGGTAKPGSIPELYHVTGADAPASVRCEFVMYYAFHLNLIDCVINTM